MWWQTGSLKDLYSVLLQLPEFKSKVKQTEEEFLNFFPDRFPYNASTRSKLFSAVCASTVTSQNVMSQMPSQKPSLERAKAKQKQLHGLWHHISLKKNKFQFNSNKKNPFKQHPTQQVQSSGLIKVYRVIEALNLIKERSNSFKPLLLEQKELALRTTGEIFSSQMRFFFFCRMWWSPKLYFFC